MIASRYSYRCIITLIISCIGLSGYAQINSKPPSSKRFIDKVEFVVGPSLCLNHGNMFIDNYKGDYANGNYVQNKRLTKTGCSLGLGAYHSINNRINLNVRILWEQKGSKTELNVPLNPVNNDAREYITYNYNYNYLTIHLAPIFYLGKKKMVNISMGVYYGILKNEYGVGSSYDTRNVIRPTSGKFKGRYWYGFRNDGGINQITFIPYLESFQENDYGISLSVSYNIPLHNANKLFIQLVDNYGLHSINNNKYPENLPEKNHNLCLMIGYKFHRMEK